MASGSIFADSDSAASDQDFAEEDLTFDGDMEVASTRESFVSRVRTAVAQCRESERRSVRSLNADATLRQGAPTSESTPISSNTNNSRIDKPNDVRDSSSSSAVSHDVTALVHVSESTRIPVPSKTLSRPQFTRKVKKPRADGLASSNIEHGRSVVSE
eukprot:TRINITY_DN26725_c0_g1_i1.p2 TRINITY_DN26725_c0_g1~~TRINITY_DN26725_c0_g1_i1.p2  ORF type:complete len:158 (+),score=17.86 TRINITY_DN26725_c0_g1_i1:65-538(+)